MHIVTKSTHPTKKGCVFLLLSYFRTLILYTLLIAVIRFMGKRQIGQMEASEFVVTMLVANLASIPMQDAGIPLFTGVIPILTVLAMELLLSGISLRSIRMRRLLCGKPVILIENGKIIQRNLKRTCVTLDELSGLLRQKDVLDPTTVQYAILETNGTLSVFPYPDQKPASAKDAEIAVGEQSLPVTVICDGKLLEHNLRISGKDQRWVDKILKEKGCLQKEVLLLAVDRSNKVIFYREEHNG